MSTDIPGLIAKARENTSMARLCLEHGSADVAASRAYYAMFYVAEAWLTSRGQAYSSHRAVSSAFGRDIAHAGLVPLEQHDYLLRAFEARHAADYGGFRALDPDRAANLIQQADEMIRTAEASLLSEEPGGGRPGQEPTEGS